jgi:hypothetical protein
MYLCLKYGIPEDKENVKNGVRDKDLSSDERGAERVI